MDRRNKANLQVSYRQRRTSSVHKMWGYYLFILSVNHTLTEYLLSIGSSKILKIQNCTLHGRSIIIKLDFKSISNLLTLIKKPTYLIKYNKYNFII